MYTILIHDIRERGEEERGVNKGERIRKKESERRGEGRGNKRMGKRGGIRSF